MHKVKFPTTLKNKMLKKEEKTEVETEKKNLSNGERYDNKKKIEKFNYANNKKATNLSHCNLSGFAYRAVYEINR